VSEPPPTSVTVVYLAEYTVKASEKLPNVFDRTMLLPGDTLQRGKKRALFQ
jgi:hypothetical protein